MEKPVLKIVRRFADLDALSREAARFICACAARCVRKRGIFSLALSGGRTPQLLYEALAAPPWNAAMPWDKVHLFWGDERCVPPDHPESNFAMADSALLSKIKIPAGNVHRIRAEVEPPGRAARSYEAELVEFFPRAEESFDLIILGLGGDGHTASLFPGSPALGPVKRRVAAVRAPRGVLPPRRITLTLSEINRSAQALFLVSGPDKAQALDLILSAPQEAGRKYPAASVRARQRLLWFVATRNEPGAESK